MSTTTGFQPPPYPYERLDRLRTMAEQQPGGLVDLSIGTPFDPPPPDVVRALGASAAERGYPPSVGTAALRGAVVDWLDRRFGVTGVPADQVAACIGTKELVAGLPQWLRLRRPDLDTVLHPAVAYPTYEMGATLAGCRAVPVAVDDQWRLDLGSISDDDAARALCLWINTPGNPAGGLDDLGTAVEWARARGIPLFSDECYIEFTWDDPYHGARGPHPGRTVLEHGADGVIAVHSLSKRSNLAGARVGWYAGDAELVTYLSETRKHAGFMVPGPVQHAAVAALADDEHVDRQRAVYRARLERMADLLVRYGVEAPLPGGGFYLWAPAPAGDAWGLAERLAAELGVVVSPGEFYGEAGAGHVRVAMVQPDDRLDLVEQRLGDR